MWINYIFEPQLQTLTVRKHKHESFRQGLGVHLNWGKVGKKCLRNRICGLWICSFETHFKFVSCFFFFSPSPLMYLDQTFTKWDTHTHTKKKKDSWTNTNKQQKISHENSLGTFLPCLTENLLSKYNGYIVHHPDGLVNVKRNQNSEIHTCTFPLNHKSPCNFVLNKGDRKRTELMTKIFWEEYFSSSFSFF